MTNRTNTTEQQTLDDLSGYWIKSNDFSCWNTCMCDLVPVVDLRGVRDRTPHLLDGQNSTPISSRDPLSLNATYRCIV